jgi:SAM-dependent methyltransferase
MDPLPVSKSRYRHVSKDEIIAEYAEASHKPADFEKAKWGSQASMLNRFRLGLSVIDWEAVRRWLDIGCGTGGFFALVEEAGHRFDALVGVDITPEGLRYARERSYASPASFVEADLEALPDGLADFDLVTLVGVLQQCGAPPERALAASAAPLKPGGQLFLTTKHLGWKAFGEGGLTPEPNHSWFDYEELAGIVRDVGFQIVESGGFLPREGKTVPLHQSHTLFLLGKKPF